jgi:acyl carrier protein
MIEAYGMTEAAHQMTSNQLPPGRRTPGSVGYAAGPEVAIMSETSGQLMHPGEIGEIVIRGANVTAGYRNNPDANAGAFTDGWFRTGDQGRFDEHGFLFISGRLKEIINRGGEKISPREIDEALLAHPDVFQALAFGVPDERLGEDVGVAVVLAPGAEVSDRDIRQFVSDRLADFKVPKVIVRLDEIPKGSTGKLQRIGFAERMGITTPSPGRQGSSGDTAATSPTEHDLTEIWKRVLGVSTVGVTDGFTDVGGDSMLATKLAMQIQRQLDVELSLVDFFEAATIREQAALIDQAKNTRAPGQS